MIVRLRAPVCRSTIQHADEIIGMDKGRIVERGTHEALLQAGGLYTKLCKMQQVD